MRNAAKQAYETEGFRAHDYLSRAGEGLWEYVPSNKLTSALAGEDVSWRTAKTITTVRTITIWDAPKQLAFDFGQQTDVAIRKQSSVLARLEEAANNGDESDFLKNLEGIGWGDKPAVEFVRAIKLAFKAGAFRAALYIASEGVKHHPDSADLQKYIRVLNPSQPAVAEPTTTVSPQANREWLKEHSHEYKGMWIAIRDGELLGASQTLGSLVEEVGRKFGITFPSKEVMVTMGS